MTTIYVVRHCEAEGNNKRIFQGLTDCDITELGKKQLNFLKKRFENIHIDRIYTSPLIRAKKTAEALNEDRNVEIVTLENLVELNGGILEAKPFMPTIRSIPGLAEIWNEHPEDFAPEGGEPMRDAYERIWNAISFIAKENPGKTVAVATHGGVIRCLNCRLIYGNVNCLKNTPWSENTAVALVTVDDSGAHLEYMNDHTHVPEEFLPVHSRLAEVASK
ncbi:MAG: histidine phosphatase family protein [Clostridia bacterium]|nr:histidine phosphatase family protein [Clostridia bacterium]